MDEGLFISPGLEFSTFHLQLHGPGHSFHSWKSHGFNGYLCHSRYPLYLQKEAARSQKYSTGALWPIRRLLGPTVIVSATIIVTTNYHCRLNYHRVACASPTVIVALHIFPLRYFQGIPSCVRGGVSLSSKASSPSHPWVSFPPIHRHPPLVPYTVYPAVFSPNAGPVRYH